MVQIQGVDKGRNDEIHNTVAATWANRCEELFQSMEFTKCSIHIAFEQVDDKEPI